MSTLTQPTPNQLREQADAQEVEAAKVRKTMRSMFQNGSADNSPELKALGFLAFQQEALASSLREVATRLELVSGARKEAEQALDRASGGLLGAIFGA